MQTQVVKHEFVEFIPQEITIGKVYVSITYATAAHLCCCGCGHEVVTPLSPTDWKLIFDGETVSLSPSIGNWSFSCQSHYWIRHNRIEWAAKWSQFRIGAGREIDAAKKAAICSNIRGNAVLSANDAAVPANTEETSRHSPTLWNRLVDWWRR